jgi:hypothetical protein
VSVANKFALDLRCHVESSFSTKIWKIPFAADMSSFLWSIIAFSQQNPKGSYEVSDSTKAAVFEPANS